MSSIAASTRSGVAGASRRGASRWSARLAMASLMASHTEIASISGGGRAVDEVVERPPRIGGEIPVNLGRAVEARRRQRYPFLPRQRRKLGEGQTAISGIDAVRVEHDLVRRHREVIRSDLGHPGLD